MADYAVEITEQDVLNAAAYVNISIKERYARAVAFCCLEPVEVKYEEDTFPTMFRENKKIKAQYLMGMLATLLRKEFSSQKLASGEELSGCMDEPEYDAWAASHVMNQMERLKKCGKPEVVNKLFDLLYDYKAFEMMLTGAIKDELEVRNDPFNRTMQWFSMSAADAAVKELVSEEIIKVITNTKGDAK